MWWKKHQSFILASIILYYKLPRPPYHYMPKTKCSTSHTSLAYNFHTNEVNSVGGVCAGCLCAKRTRRSTSRCGRHWDARGDASLSRMSPHVLFFTCLSFFILVIYCYPGHYKVAQMVLRGKLLMDLIDH